MAEVEYMRLGFEIGDDLEKPFVTMHVNVETNFQYQRRHTYNEPVHYSALLEFDLQNDGSTAIVFSMLP